MGLLQKRTTVAYDQYPVPPRPIINQRFRVSSEERHGGRVVRGAEGMLVILEVLGMRGILSHTKRPVVALSETDVYKALHA
jgi:hypothetical protein